MLISHLYQFIFIKTRKTAGTSIEIALSRYMGPNDVISEMGPMEDEVLRHEWSAMSFQNVVIPKRLWRPWHWVRAAKGRPIRYFEHMSARSARRFIPRRVWKNYFKFSIDRNPWDLAVSAYWWRYRNREPAAFREFIYSDALTKFSNWGMYSISDRVVVDWVIRYDQLTNSLAELAARLGLPNTPELPRAKANVRLDRRPYQEMYDDATRERVAHVFRREIAAFGWQF